MVLPKFFFIILGYALCALAATASVLHQFPSGTWIENVAVRSNGNLLVVLYDRPEIHEINPFTIPPTVDLVARFDDATGIQGIAETAEDSDIFVVMPYQGSEYSLRAVNLRWREDDRGLGSTVTIIPRIEGAKALNGMTRLSDNILLAADTSAGNVVRFDVLARKAEVVIQDETMVGLPIAGAGINGFRMHNSYAYYTNFFKGILCRVPIHPTEGTPTGPIQILADGLGILDDLAVADDGTAYVMQYLQGSVIAVHEDGRRDVVAEGLDRPTSAQFGRTEIDRDVLYVVGSGNPLGPYVRGVFEGGRVYAIDLSS